MDELAQQLHHCCCVFSVDSQLSLYFGFILLLLDLHLVGLLQQGLGSQRRGGEESQLSHYSKIQYKLHKNINHLDLVRTYVMFCMCTRQALAALANNVSM